MLRQIKFEFHILFFFINRSKKLFVHSMFLIIIIFTDYYVKICFKSLKYEKKKFYYILNVFLNFIQIKSKYK
jgi:hypothetical protein